MFLYFVQNNQGQSDQFSPYMVSEVQAISSSGDISLRLLSPVAANNPEVARPVLDNDLNNDGAADGIVDPLVVVGFLRPLAAANKSEATVGVLDQDLDHDGNPDGLTDPLVVVEVLLVLAGLVSGRLFLALYKAPKPSSFLPQLLERPG